MPVPFFVVCLFVGFGFFQLSLLNGFRWEYGLAGLGWFICFGSLIQILNRRLPKINAYLLPLVSFLTGLGLLMIARLAPNFLMRQVIWLVISSVLLVALIILPRNLNWLRRYKYTFLVGGLVLLATTLVFGVNPSGYGARLWLGFGNVFFQPSEPLKILVIIFLAVYLAGRHKQIIEDEAQISGLHIPHPAHVGPMLVMWSFSMVLLFWQRDLGAALLFFCTFFRHVLCGYWATTVHIFGLIFFINCGGHGVYGF